MIGLSLSTDIQYTFLFNFYMCKINQTESVAFQKNKCKDAV